MKYMKDISGQTSNMLTFIEFNSRRNKHIYWLCRCECGEYKVLRVSHVKSGKTKSCGCLQYKYEDFIGQTLNEITFIKHNHTDKYGGQHWLCQCDCGKICSVAAASLKNGHTKSCGCLQIESVSGENNKLWRYDLTKEDRENNKNRGLCPKNYKWRTKVFIRDNYTCRCCGDNKSGKLQVHHIYSYHSHKKLRYVTTNGITLCEKCHKEFHKEFGRKHNTRKQLNKFLSEQRLKCPKNFSSLQ